MRETGLIGALLEQRYRVDAPLARGGMSAVYRGVDTRLDRPVAIKVMDPRFAADRSFVERFEREARSAARIHHPNVVAVHDQGLDGDHVYLVMELVTGGTLRDLLAERGALPPPLALSVLEPVLAALAAAHAAGLVHRDVKPENVLIGANGVVKVADFGLVRALSSPGTTKSSVILGTVSYLAPEQVTTGKATPSGDVYSAGIVLYEMLTGAPPYVGDNPLTVAYRHANDDVPPPSAVARGLTPALDELVVRATRRDPATRPVDGAAFLAELQRVRTTSALPRMRIPVPQPQSSHRPAPLTSVPVTSAPPAAVPMTSAPLTPGSMNRGPGAPGPGTPTPGNPAPGTPAPGNPLPVTPVPVNSGPGTLAQANPALGSAALGHPGPGTPAPGISGPGTPGQGNPAPGNPALGDSGPLTSAPATSTPFSPTPAAGPIVPPPGAATSLETSTGTTPPGSTPAGGTPPGGTPLGGTPAGGTPLGGTPPGGTPLGGASAEGASSNGVGPKGAPSEGTSAENPLTDDDRTIRATPTDPDNEPTERAVAPVEDPEATIRVSAGTLAAAGIATVMRPAHGFSAAGPQGTRAMLRSDLEKAIAAAQPPPQTGPQPIPPGPPPPPPSRTRRYVLLGISGVLVLALIGGLTWWFTSGRYTAVPDLAGREVAAAEAAVREAGLAPSVKRVRDNEIPQGVVISSEPAATAEVLRGDEVVLVVSSGRPVVPDVRPGTDPVAAEAAIRANDLQPQRDDAANVHDEQVPEGMVVRLEPPAGTAQDIGQRVVIVLSLGPAPKPVPDVRGQTRDEAFATLTNAGFQPVDGPQEFAADIEGGRVIRTDPAANTQVDSKAGKQVTVIVSSAVTVPDLTGKTVPEAQALVAEKGLAIELQPFSNGNGRVLNQSPGPGSRVEPGGKVAVFAF